MTQKKFLLLTIALLLTSCATERISCWNEDGQLTYMGGYDLENKTHYIVDVADGVRDFHSKQNCQLHESADS